MSDPQEQNVATMNDCETRPEPTESWFGRLRARFLQGLTTDVWTRIGLLFLALCLVKVAMLIGLRKYIFETHWRIGGQPFTWDNLVGFYGFALIAGANFWAFGTRCMAGGPKVARAGNLFLLFFSATFILMTFHEGDKNYLSPVMHGILGLDAIGWYMVNNFCFEMPYLALWVAGYAMVYYGFVRKGREPQALRVTAVCATVYIAVCMNDLADYRNELMIANAFGIASLWSLLRGKATANFLWVLTPLAWLVFILFLYRGFEGKLHPAHFYPEFSVFLYGGLVLFGGATVVAWRRGFLDSWSRILPFAFVASLLLIDVNYGPAKNYNNMLCSAFTLPRYFIGEFFIAAILLVLAAFYRGTRPNGRLWWLDLATVTLVLWALADLKLSRVMGARLDWSALSLAIGETPVMMWRMAKPYLPAVMVMLAVIVAFYAMTLRVVRRTALLPGTAKISGWKRDARYFVLAFVLLGLAGGRYIDDDKVEGQATLVLAKTSPLWNRASIVLLEKEEFIETARRLGMEQLVSPHAPPTFPRRDLNVVVVFQESTYNKYLSLFSGEEETQPLLAQYRDRMEIFPNFYSSFASSINARFTTFTGLYPVGDYKAFTLKRVGVRSIFEILHDHGYHNSIFYSSSYDYTSFRDFLRGRQVHSMYDAETMPGERKLEPVSWGLREEETLAAMQEQIRQYAADKKKFFMTYIPAAPHYPFDGTPKQFRKYQKKKMGDHTPLYLNELLYMDWIISSIVDQLKESQLLDNTIVIITSDHGELLGQDEGPIGHGWLVTPELANVPLIIMDPQKPGYRINRTTGSQADLLPTILDLLGIPMSQNDLYQGTSLYATSRVNRAIYSHSYNQYLILTDDKILCGTRDKKWVVKGTEYAVTNEGPRTRFFEPVESPEDGAASKVKTDDKAKSTEFSISEFDTFQASLLHYYSRYRELLSEQAISSK